VQQVGYLADPMAKDSAEAEPMHQAKKRVSPTVVVPRYLLHSTRSIQQVVEEPGLVRSSLRPIAVEPDFAHPMGRVVVEQVTGNSRQQAAAEPGFVHPILRAVVVEPDFVPSLVFVVAEPGFVRPILRAVVVEPAFADPILLVVAGHSKHWVVDQVGSKNLHLAYFPVGSIQVVEPVVPDVANLKMQQH
jgi:hypothetical protein